MKKGEEINFSPVKSFLVRERADTKGGIKRGIKSKGIKNSLAFVWKERKDKRIPRAEKEKETKINRSKK
jgi:hypothetical protein